MTTVLDSLNQALHRTFARDERVYLLGEDILDPYGGAFKVSRGLSTAYPDRVLTTPISEAGITGLATGMALRGLRPVVEIMFGDFITLIADQLVNHATKFRWMYNDQVRVPLVIRTPMGGRRGYGPTHSQTIEKLYLGVPGLRILAPCAVGDPGLLLENAILLGDDPVLFVENKLLYLTDIINEGSQSEFSLNPLPPDPSPLFPGDAPAYSLSIKGAPPAALSIAAYGYMAEIARQAALKLAYEREIFVELIVPTQLVPFQGHDLLESAAQTGALLVVEEGTLTAGWGAEIVARATEALGTSLRCVRRLAALDLPVPSSAPLEDAVLPGVEQIIQIAEEMV
ncbi:MAG: transketolase C-terminal domain-containing protein [Chloroflexota bacterium]|nr:transketolase C-terminal domain-containing protein [Chloroflexota bacterium]